MGGAIFYPILVYGIYFNDTEELINYFPELQNIESDYHKFDSWITDNYGFGLLYLSKGASSRWELILREELQNEVGYPVIGEPLEMNEETEIELNENINSQIETVKSKLLEKFPDKTPKLLLGIII